MTTQTTPAPEAMEPDAVERARAHFPRGLAQPAGGFRFGADTLLLAAFAARHLPRGGPGAEPLRGLELGCGCGAASLGLLLLAPERNLSLTGIDLGPDMVAAAEANAALLGLAHRFRAEVADVNQFRLPAGPDRQGRSGRQDLVLANPPFRIAGTGRGAATPEKDRARFEGPGGLAAFCACAARCLRPQGRLFLVHLAERLPEILRLLGDHGLNPARLLPVHGRQGRGGQGGQNGADRPARLVLIEAVRGGRGALTLEPGLVLYGPEGALSAQAEAFCPPLAANPRRGARN